MISRHWKGTVKHGLADRYIDHLTGETLPQLTRIDGFVSASILRRDASAGSEFQVVTVRKSLEAIRQFAGPDPEVAVVPAAAQAMMIAFDHRAVHYEVVALPASARTVVDP